jgi:hypothetical protein
MTFFPLLARELNTRATAHATYWLRSGIGLIGILISIEAIGLGPLAAPALAGKYIFNGLVGSAFLLSCGGCLLTADTLSAELREGTLVLLFLTRVKTVDILLSKLGSIGIAGLWSLLALLPVLTIPILVGGVTGGDAFRKALALMDTLFFALSAGLWASAGQEDRARSTRKAVLTVILIVVIPLIPFSVMPRLFHSIGLFSPFVLVLLAGDIRYGGSKALYWISLSLLQGLSWIFLGWAGLSLKRVVSAADAAAFQPSSAAKKEERALGLASWQPNKEDSHPLEWAIYRRNGISAGLWVIAVVGVAFSSCLNLARQSIGMSGASSFWLLAPSIGVITSLAGAVLVAWVASRFFIAARRNGTLELLLTTPLGAETLLAEQSKVLRRMFALPILLMQAAVIPQLLQGLARTNTGVGGWQGYLALFTLLSLANTYFGIETLSWLGLWFGVKARSQAGATCGQLASAKAFRVW